VINLNRIFKSKFFKEIVLMCATWFAATSAYDLVKMYVTANFSAGDIFTTSIIFLIGGLVAIYLMRYKK